MDNSEASCISSIYHKSTYTGLLTHFLSLTCFKYRVGLIYTLVDRIVKINNTTTGREKDLQQLSLTLQRNSFPSHLIDKIIKGYKNKFSFRPTQNNTSTTGENTTCTQYFKKLAAIRRWFLFCRTQKTKTLVGRFLQRYRLHNCFFFSQDQQFVQFQRSIFRCIENPGCVSIYLCRM